MVIDIRRQMLGRSHKSVRSVSVVRSKDDEICLVFVTEGPFAVRFFQRCLVRLAVQNGPQRAGRYGRIYRMAEQAGDAPGTYRFRFVSLLPAGVVFQDEGRICNVESIDVLTVPARPFSMPNESWRFGVSQGFKSY